jgi:putative transcriptional regulator
MQRLMTTITHFTLIEIDEQRSFMDRVTTRVAGCPRLPPAVVSDAMGKSDLAPGLLLAAPSLQDPNFERTVVLLGRHGGDGALGWVINGRELMPVRELLRASELLPQADSFPESPPFVRSACVGGPVAPAAGWLVYRRQPDALPGEIAVGPDIGVSGELAAFSTLLGADGPTLFRLLLGCAGWGPGQLEAEISAGAWLPAAVELELVFETALDAIWDGAYRLGVGADPAAFTSRRGQA